MATIYDVAVQAQVSTATVSRVINSPEQVSLKTREKVESAIEALNYAPNALARELVTRSTNLVGLIIPHITNTFIPSIVDSFSREIGKHGYSIFICVTDADSRVEARQLNIMLEKRVEGIVLAGMREIKGNDQALLKAARQVPVLLVDTSVSDEIYSIASDEEEGAYQAIRYLIELGHRKIAFLNGDIRFTTYEAKRRGVVRALKESGMETEAKYLITVEGTFDGGYLGAKELLELSSPPTAIFTAGDQMAVGVYRAVQETGRRIPDDISVIGFSGSPLSAAIYPGLTTVSQYAKETGYEAAGMLVKILNNQEVTKHVILEPKLIKRESCRKITA